MCKATIAVVFSATSRILMIRVININNTNRSSVPFPPTSANKDTLRKSDTAPVTAICINCMGSKSLPSFNTTGDKTETEEHTNSVFWSGHHKNITAPTGMSWACASTRGICESHKNDV